MSKHFSMTGALTGCAILLVACFGAAETTPPAAGADQSHASQVPAGEGAGQVDAAIVERGRQALRDAGITGEARLLASEAAQWSDSSLGCRRPGEVYLQVITTGHVLRFAVDGEAYEVHVAGPAARVCQPALSGAPKRAAPPVRARDLQSLIDRARADLAGRLGRESGEVTLQNAVPFTWNDETFACGNAEASNVSLPVSGYKFLLRSAGQVYVYHTDLALVFACPPIEAE